MDYYKLLNIKIKYHTLLIIIIITLIITVIFFIKIEVYDNFLVKGINKNECIYVNIPLEYSDTIGKMEYLKVNNKKYNYEIANISNVEIDQNNLINYQVYEIKIDNNSFFENEIVNVNIYYDKEKIITKIKEILL